jgi:hypothetical protein
VNCFFTILPNSVQAMILLVNMNDYGSEPLQSNLFLVILFLISAFGAFPFRSVCVL